MAFNAITSAIADRIPTGTNHPEVEGLLEKLGDLGRDAGTVRALLTTGLKGEPLDDKQYLMEKVIQMVADQDKDSRLSHTLTNKFLHELWTDLDHPPNSYLGYDFAFRKADGSYNNILWPHIGEAGQPYARSVRPRKMQPPRPDPEVIYDSVLARKEFRPHPNKISSVLFYVASIIIHDCFHTSHEDYAISETSSYLDLSPLYGSNEADQKKVRTMKDGKLHPDTFADNRIHGFPPGVAVLLIMFNRFHNHVVENLKKIDENGRFSKISDPRERRRTGLIPRPKPKPPVSEGQKQDNAQEKEPSNEEYLDEALFQHGRLITCGLYINIVLNDYVRTILGLNRTDALWNLDPRSAYSKGFAAQKIPEAQGNQVSAEFSLVYRWHACVSKRDEAWSQELVDGIEKDSKIVAALKGMGVPEPYTLIMKAAVWAELIKKIEPKDRTIENLKRGADGKFSDDELCNIWSDSVEDVAGAFGAAHVPQALKFVEVLSMKQARNWNLASLNEFREYFKLAPHKTFESINPDKTIAEQLERLYGHPDNVEIYPGIVVESAKKAMDPGSGLCCSWTISRAILADAVSLIRSDRFYTVDYTPANLTNWGFQAASSDLDINHGAVFYKLVLNAFPNHVKKNSVYAHFPLVNPSAQQTEILPKMKREKLYSYTRPEARAESVTVAATSQDASKIVSESTHASSMSGLGAATRAPAIKLTFAQAILDNPKFSEITTKFYKTTFQKLWNSAKYELGNHSVVDIVADVLNAAHVSFITSVLDVQLSDDETKQQDILTNLGYVASHAYSCTTHPHGVNTSVRSFGTWFVGALTHGWYGKPAIPEGHLGKQAFENMSQANGKNTEAQAWHDVLPTSALLLTTLSRSTAAAVESVLEKKPLPPPFIGTVAMKATSDAGDAQKGQIINTNLSDAVKEGNIEQFGSDVKLAYKVTEIASKAIADLLATANGLERMPGYRGVLKRFDQVDGTVKYMNETWSDYVVCPVSLQVRWQGSKK